MAFLGKSIAEININVSKFADAFIKHHMETKSNIIDDR